MIARLTLRSIGGRLESFSTRCSSVSRLSTAKTKKNCSLRSLTTTWVTRSHCPKKRKRRAKGSSRRTLKKDLVAMRTARPTFGRIPSSGESIGKRSPTERFSRRSNRKSNTEKMCQTSTNSSLQRKRIWRRPTSCSWWTWTKLSSPTSLFSTRSLFNTSDGVTDLWTSGRPLNPTQCQ